MKTIVGLFDTHTHAEIAAHELERAGIFHTDISLLANNTAGRFPTGTDPVDAPDTGSETGKGAVAGGVAGLLLGLAAIAIPGLGVIAAAGWLTTMVAGAVVGAGVGLVGALNGIGVSHEDAAHYAEGIRRGGTLLAVRAEDDQAAQVAQILSAGGAVDINERAAQYRQEGVAPPVAQTPVTLAEPTESAAVTNQLSTPPSVSEPVTAAVPTATPAVAANDIERDSETPLPIADAGASGGTHEAEYSGVRVYPHTSVYPVEEIVSVREEYIEVELQPSDIPAEKADTSVAPSDLRAMTFLRAYALWEQRGHREGYADEDWFDAERELRSNIAAQTAA